MFGKAAVSAKIGAVAAVLKPWLLCQRNESGHVIESFHGYFTVNIWG
jgi:hypothetical protein